MIIVARSGMPLCSGPCKYVLVPKMKYNHHRCLRVGRPASMHPAARAVTAVPPLCHPTMTRRISTTSRPRILAPPRRRRLCVQNRLPRALSYDAEQHWKLDTTIRLLFNATQTEKVSRSGGSGAGRSMEDWLLVGALLVATRYLSSPPCSICTIGRVLARAQSLVSTIATVVRRGTSNGHQRRGGGQRPDIRFAGIAAQAN
jgi:hypothetical protein